MYILYRLVWRSRAHKCLFIELKRQFVIRLAPPVLGIRKPLHLIGTGPARSHRNRPTAPPPHLIVGPRARQKAHAPTFKKPSYRARTHGAAPGRAQRPPRPALGRSLFMAGAAHRKQVAVLAPSVSHLTIRH